MIGDLVEVELSLLASEIEDAADVGSPVDAEWAERIRDRLLPVLRKAPEVPAHWIAVADELPPDGDTAVLVWKTNHNGDRGSVFRAEQNDSWERTLRGGRGRHDWITVYWARLPLGPPAHPKGRA